MSNVKHKPNTHSDASSESGVEISLDPRDLDSLIELMDKYSHLGSKFFGKDEEGQSVTISIWTEHIIVDTLQKNGWTRRNIYYRDGYREELFSKDGNFK